MWWLRLVMGMGVSGGVGELMMVEGNGMIAQQ